MKNKTKKRKRLKAKVRSKTELAGLLMTLQAEHKDLADRLAIAEAQIANLLALVPPRLPNYPAYPGGWSPTWPYTFHEVRTEVQK